MGVPFLSFHHLRQIVRLYTETIRKFKRKLINDFRGDGDNGGYNYRIYFNDSHLWGVDLELFLSERKYAMGKTVDV
ncbi:hypothetical protein GCM10011384_12210 [Psychrobacillus lasiicapitis]|nr:hypothetical protein GCM10011384_12210 [Psychrobacillus lasiicapitis]